MALLVCNQDDPTRRLLQGDSAIVEKTNGVLIELLAIDQRTGKSLSTMGRSSLTSQRQARSSWSISMQKADVGSNPTGSGAERQSFLSNVYGNDSMRY